MRLSIKHVTDYAYDPGAGRVVMRLKLFPLSFEGQYVESWSVTVNGEPAKILSRTGFGDDLAIWTSKDVTDKVQIVAEGVIDTEDRAGVVADLPGRPPKAVFLRDTPLTKRDEDIEALAASVEADNPLGWLHALNAVIGERVTYTKGETDSKTTAAEALKLGKGVCQDHAHVFIAAARSKKIPARYVVGYILTEDQGHVESHAWAECWVDRLGWVAFDPSHNVCPTDRYVRLACGLDAKDAAPVRGCVAGGEEVSHSARVELATLTQTQ